MAALVDDGLVRSIGLSNHDQADIAQCHRERPVDVIQDGLSVIDHLEHRDLIDWCGERGIAATIFEPLASGILTDTPFEQVRERWIGSAWESMTVYPGLMAPENADRARHIVDGLRAIGDQIGATVAQVAIAWVLRQPGVSSAIVGSSNADRARSNAVSAEIHLSDEALRTIDEDLIPRGPAFA